MDFSWIAQINWAAIGQIILIDILLGGDNAVVIALACRNLPVHQRTKGIIWGTAGAIVLRVILIAFAVTMLKIPFLKLIGGLLLFWIGIKLLVGEDDGDHSVAGSASLWGAVKTIIIADFVMSLDNVIAIAGAAESTPGDHQFAYIVFGLLVSIPIIVWGSTLVLKLIDRFPLIVTAGAALLGWIAGGMIVTDVAWTQYVGPASSTVKYAAAIAGAIFVAAVGTYLGKRNAKVA
ncbi:MAG: TerC family protein [Burkholderiales bacterium]|nr:MAG: TerC family protein [Betaproteobacteria bacterium]TAG83999.1 MAG: TerC family protein [Burkholderiales bacterium]